jgi:hypothetical protein
VQTARGEAEGKSSDQPSEPDAEGEDRRKGNVQATPDGDRVGIVSREKIVAGFVGDVQRNSEGEGDPRKPEVPVQRAVEHGRVPPDAPVYAGGSEGQEAFAP